MNISTEHVRRCVRTLEAAYAALQGADRHSVAHDIYRAACVKEFEIVLEQSGKLVRKWLGAYFADKRQADRLHFKEVFRHAAKHGLVSVECGERWLAYRDARNETAHDYGELLVNQTPALLPQFITDAQCLATALDRGA